jgi:hypothetical protein
MDYFGWTLWTELFLAHKDWLDSLNLGEPDDFDPETDVWDRLFQVLQHVMNESGLAKNLGACFHISSDIARMTGNFNSYDILPRYIAARENFTKKIPFDLGVHSQFSPQLNPLGVSYSRAFMEDIDRAVKLDSQVIVSHPPHNPSYNHREILDLIVDDVCKPERLERLSQAQTTLAWENMIEGQFSSLEELLLLVHTLQDRMREQGYPEVAGHQQICLDTGHLLIWRAHHYSISCANTEIERFMPEIGKELRVYHIHGNDGSQDFHISPHSTDFLDHPTRKGLDTKKHLENWASIQEWIRICENHKRLEGRHIHLETDKVPFSLTQMIEFGRWYAKML